MTRAMAMNLTLTFYCVAIVSVALSCLYSTLAFVPAPRSSPWFPPLPFHLYGNVGDGTGTYSESSVLSRLEALEGRVESLERRIMQSGGGRDRRNHKAAAVARHTTRKSVATQGRRIEEITPTFRDYIQEGTPGYTNPFLSMGSKSRNGDDDREIKFVTIQGSF
ncbi:unnamed protein product [Pseudo-nitzschia multistriata]|uniref:Uncharacterized protein n=1 Tax=Pseudo-nitzschia multistriata TaxID=183589 RepID=A0A448ZH49_9STRA|nr:unnamed protein product [Pseudo-nitzschia multistriata]